VGVSRESGPSGTPLRRGCFSKTLKNNLNWKLQPAPTSSEKAQGPVRGDRLVLQAASHIVTGDEGAAHYVRWIPGNWNIAAATVIPRCFLAAG